MRCYLFTSSCYFAVFAILGHGVLVAEGEPVNTIVNVGVYYESLCGDSMRWIRDQLVPSYDVLKDYISVTFIPYGKASHSKDAGTSEWKFTCQHGSAECDGNMAQACGIHAIQKEEPSEKVQQLTVALVGCAMSSSYPPSAVPQCAEKVGLSEKTRSSINECIAGSLSKELLVANGEKTKALTPKLAFVPTITINDETSSAIQSQVLVNFLKVVCDNLPKEAKPSQCSSV